MGVFDRIFARTPPTRAKSTSLTVGQLEAILMADRVGDQDVAMRVAAVYACVKVIAETIASLPKHLYQSSGGNRRKVDDDPVARLVRLEPNPYQTGLEWCEQMMVSALLHGNAYSEIVRSSDGTILELNVLSCTAMQVERGQYGPRYIYQPLSGGRRIYEMVSPADYTKIIHLRGLSSYGLIGRSVLRDAADVIRAADSAQQYGRRILENDATPGLVLKHPQVLDEEAAKRLRESWQEAYAGPKNAGRVAVLEEGMTLEKLTMSNEDLQFLEMRKYTRSEIASLFRVPPHMIGDLERSTFSNIEQQSIEFVMHTLRPWVVRFEQVLDAALLSDTAQRRNSLYFSFALEGLLRGDLQSRYAAYATARQWGWLSVNDIRSLENLNLIGSEGDRYLEPLNMQAAAPSTPQEPI